MARTREQRSPVSRPLLGVLTACGLILAVAACSSSSPTASPSPDPTQSPSAPQSPSTPGGSQLTIVVDDGSAAPTTWTLSCDPAGGTHPDPEGACAALSAHRSALDPVPGDKMCAQVFSGPEKATISGTWQDEQVLATLSRVNSCETARWDALVPLLPSGGR